MLNTTKSASGKRKIIAIVGMAGSGKSEVADFLIKKGYEYVRLGQIALDILKEKKMPPGEASEKKIREGLRKKHGMAAFAILNMPRIKKLKGNVVIDGLYSWEEYLYFKQKLPEMIVVCVYASPKTRYERLENRAARHGADPILKYRSFKKTESQARDHAELENLHKGGPIAMADYTIVNEGTKQELINNLNKIWRRMNAR